MNGQRLRYARNQCRMTQADLALRIGTTRTQVSRWENESRDPSVIDLEILCIVLGVTPNDLLGWL